MAREYFCAYYSYLEAMEPLGDVEVGRLFRACLQYGKSGIAPALNGNERMAFAFVKQQIDRDAEKYNKKCEINRENGAKGSKANAAERGPESANAPRTPPKEKEKKKEKTKEKETIPNGIDIGAKAPPREKTKRFIPPAVEEVAAYCQERNNAISPQQFIDHYTANGWMAGKVPMKDWRAAVRNWEKNSYGNRQGGKDWWEV